MSRSGAGNNAALCGFWPWRSLIKALAFLGTVGRETWPAQPPVPFTRCLGLLLGEGQGDGQMDAGQGDARRQPGHPGEQIRRGGRNELEETVPNSNREAGQRLTEKEAERGAGGSGLGGPIRPFLLLFFFFFVFVFSRAAAMASGGS